MIHTLTKVKILEDGNVEATIWGELQRADSCAGIGGWIYCVWARALQRGAGIPKYNSEKPSSHL